MRPNIAFLADDFTGATDVILQAIRLSRSATLFVDIPSTEQLQDAAGKYEVIGIASVIRSLDVHEATRYVERAFEQFAAINPRVVQYKICSTADSSPTRGSIKPAVDAGRMRFGDQPIPVLVAQPNLGRYTAFSTHFARDASGVHRLDRNAAMANHPATPMNEADLRLHFATQLEEPVGGLHLPLVGDAGATRAGAGVYVVDAITEDDLSRAAAWILRSSPTDTPQFVIGSGGLSIGLLDQLSKPPPEAADARPTRTRKARTAPVLAVSGSGAPETSRQIDAAAAAGWELVSLDVTGDPAALDDRIQAATAVALTVLRAGRSCLVFTTHDRLAPRAQFVEAVTVGTALGNVILQVAESMILDRVIVAGGDTSGYVLRRLGATRIDAAGSIAGELLLASIQSKTIAVSGLEVVLKGGQLGPRDVFEQARVTPSSGRIFAVGSAI